MPKWTSPSRAEKSAIRVFTTRPDTLFGATYMVLAPEHALVDELTTPEQRAAVDAYRRDVTKQDLVERQKVDKDKTGVFTGSTCINPVNGDEIPVWIADYVLMGYGTGAIMAVPGHDHRDFEFATRFDLPVVRVIAEPGCDADTPLTDAFDGDGRLVNSGEFDGLSVADGKRAIIESLEARGLGTRQVNYRLHDWCVSRQRYWGPPIPIIHCQACGPVPVPEADLPVVHPYLDDFRPDDSGVSPLARAKDLVRDHLSFVRIGPRTGIPMSPTISCAAAGTSCAIRARTGTMSPSTPNSRANGCRWIATSVATSTPSCT